MKRMFSLLLAVCLLTAFAPASFAEDGFTISFNATAPTYSQSGPVARFFNNTVEPTLVKTYTGETGWQLNRRVPSRAGESETRGHSEICINMQNTYMKNLDGNRNLLITIRYYDGKLTDRGTKFCVDYNSHSYQWESAGIVTLGGTYRWKEVTFTAERPKFSGIGGPVTDVKVCIASNYIGTPATPTGDKDGATVVISSVNIKYAEERTLFYSLKTENTGNIFFNEDPAVITAEIENPLQDDYGCINAEYILTNKLTQEKRSGSFEIPLENKAVSTGTVTFEDLPFGIYRLDVNFLRDGSLLKSDYTEFSRVSALSDPHSLSSAFPKSNFGTNTHIDTYGTASTEPTLKLGRRMGAEYVRLTINRSACIQSDGSIKLAANQMEFLQTAKRQGLKVMVVLTAGRLGDYPNLRPYRQTGIDDIEGEFNKYLAVYDDFVYNMVSQYGEYVECWEIMNEYNLLDQTYPGITFNGKDYADILKTGYTAAKRADENAFVVGGALGGILPDFVEEMCDAGGAAYMDALSVHLYPPYLSDENPNNPENEYENYTQRWLDRANLIRETLNEYGATPEIWLDEFNYSGDNGDQWKFESVVKLIVRNEFENVFERIYQYLLEDSGYSNDSLGYGLITRPVDNFGVLKVPSAAGYGYLALSHCNSLLAGTQPLSYQKDANGNRIYKFYDSVNDRNVYVLWNQDTTSSVTITEAGTALCAYDMIGNEITSSADGSITVSTGDSPIYVAGPQKDLMIKSDTVTEKVTITGTASAGSQISAIVLKKETQKADFVSSQQPLNHILYANQVETDAEGVYSFTFKAVQGEGSYTVLITNSDGLQQSYEMEYREGKLTVSCNFIKDGADITDITDLTDGALNVEMTINNDTGITTDYIILGAMYKDEKLVSLTPTVSGLLTQGHRKLERNLIIPDISVGDIDTIKIFIFNNMGEIKPLHTSFELK